MKDYDKNRDGKLDSQELQEHRTLRNLWRGSDANQDNLLDQGELLAMYQRFAAGGAGYRGPGGDRNQGGNQGGNNNYRGPGSDRNQGGGNGGNGGNRNQGGNQGGNNNYRGPGGPGGPGGFGERPEDQAARWVRFYDRDNDGKLTPDEIIPTQPISKDRVPEFDLNRDGKLDQQELVNAFQKIQADGGSRRRP
jgi:Ca2+-binding EF-hand superfamily protein